MRANRENLHRPAILVVAGMGDELCVERCKESTPVMRRVIAFENVLAGIVQPPVAEQEAESAEREVLLVVALDGVGDTGEADLVIGPRPAVAGEVRTQLEGLIDLRVGIAFVLALVPPEAAEGAEAGCKFLL
jgi:hypothetical protein